MIGQSQSGTGKTAAFALTMLSRVDMDLKKPQVSQPPHRPATTTGHERATDSRDE